MACCPLVPDIPTSYGLSKHGHCMFGRFGCILCRGCHRTPPVGRRNALEAGGDDMATSGVSERAVYPRRYQVATTKEAAQPCHTLLCGHGAELAVATKSDSTRY